MKSKTKILCVATIACVLLITFCLGSDSSPNKAFIKPQSTTLEQRVTDLERRVSLLEIHIQEPNEPDNVKREALRKRHHLKEKEEQELREQRRRERIERDNKRQIKRDRKAKEHRVRTGRESWRD